MTGRGRVIKFYRRCSWLLLLTGCAGFVFGELLYVVGSLAADAKNAVVNVPRNCMSDLYDWLYTFTYFLGMCSGLPICRVHALGGHELRFEQRYEDWFLGGQKTPSPRYRWVGLWWWSPEWWGAMCYFWAVIGYNLSSVASIIYDCRYINPVLYTWITAYTRIGSGILFLFAGAFYSMASSCLQEKTLDQHDVVGHVDSLVGWCLLLHDRIFLYWYNPINTVLNEDAFLVQQTVGFGFGSLLFHIGGVLMLARQSRARCRPSVEASPGDALA
ncbi:hypothetical protein WJX84_009253 [Apatococcus fuscideae]|uniref:Uncharacterized protein n=1 Tax=Apatococcus fuscideae TaxID=2026836 RepID=A0AAW1T1U6_9CHLO